MNKILQVRLSAAVHRKLKARAALEGLTLSDYVRKLIERDLEKPSIKEWLANLQTRTKVDLDPPPEELIRQDRIPVDCRQYLGHWSGRSRDDLLSFARTQHP